MSNLRQILALTGMNLRSVPQRLGTSCVIVVGIAGVVGVLLSLLAMVVGLRQTVAGTGRPDRAIVIREGSGSEIMSSLEREAARTIMDAPGVRRSPDGKPIASAETLTLVELPKKTGTGRMNAVLRGIGPAAFALRPEMKLVEGRLFRPAVHELIVGRQAQARFEGLKLGQRVNIPGGDWRVVGVFESAGDRHESELVTDSETMLSAFRRNYFSPVIVQLESPAALERFSSALTTDPTLVVDVERESDYYAEQSRAVSRVLSVIAYVIGGIMAIGAIFAALNAMYAAVSSRSVEIATLRAVGFRAGAVVASVLAEALLLALLGAAVGSAAAWLLFDDNIVSTNFGGIGQLAFPLTVNPAMIAVGVVWACVIGAVGGLFAAIRAARLPVAETLRAI